MCGIVGMICKQGSLNKKLIEDMLDIIKHRGPDDEGIYTEEKLALGHRRLSILDLSHDGKQPMNYLSRYWITYNGEVYNYIELKKELVNLNYSFVTQTDTEVILAAYDYWGKECVKHFNGMWSFCIYDKLEQTLFCSRDRFGIKPFYYQEGSDYFVFGSEIKQLLIAMNTAPKVNHDMLAAYLVCGALDYTQETMFENIYQLLGGHNLIYSLKDNKYTIEKWYELYDVNEKKQTFDENSAIFKKQFDESIRLRLRSDVPVGFCLSGGLDSSAIVCMANSVVEEKEEKPELHTISSCFEDKKYDEQEYIEAVIDKTGVLSHKVFPEMSELFTDLDKLIWHMDEPFGSTSIFAQWNVYKEAKRQGLTVMLDGQGADEQLAGYSVFYDLLFGMLMRKGKFKRLIHEVKCYNKLKAESEERSAKLHLKIALANAVLPIKLRNFIRMKQKAYTPAHLFSKEILYNGFVIKILNKNGATSPRKYIHTRLHFGMSALLHYEDRNSMAYSIEARLPFLDYKLVEAIYSMPLDHKISDGITKRVMREALKDTMPKKIVERHSKLGFVTPEDKWIKENGNMIREELVRACRRLSPIIEEKKVLGWYDDNINNLKVGDFAIWRIICAARWADLFKVEM